MALKDWKKVGKDEWRNDKDNVLLIYESTQKFNGKTIWSVRYGLIGGFYENLDVFKTKLQALKYAKAYMRKH